MTKKIEDGKILAQKIIANDENNLSKIYKKCFAISSDLILVAIDNLTKNKFLLNKYKKTYNTFPTDKDWKEFRKNNGKFA